MFSRTSALSCSCPSSCWPPPCWLVGKGFHGTGNRWRQRLITPGRPLAPKPGPERSAGTRHRLSRSGGSSRPDPHHYATGIPDVLVNGIPVIKNGENRGAKASQALRHVCAPWQRGVSLEPQLVNEKSKAVWCRACLAPRIGGFASRK